MAPPESWRRDVALWSRQARAHLDCHNGNIVTTLVTQELSNPRQQIGVYPINDESIRRKQLQRSGPLHHLQRANPRIELLLRKLSLQGADTLSPMRRFHAMPPRPPRRDLRKGLRSLYLVPRVLKPLGHSTARCAWELSIDTLALNGLALPPFLVPTDQ